MKYPSNVITTWDTTIRQLSPVGRSLLHQLSWLAPEPVPRSLIPEGEVQEALAELAGFSLAKLNETGVTFRIHGLVQDVTRERQSSDEARASLRSALELVKAAVVGNPQDVRTWLIWEPLSSHMTAVTTYADQHGNPRFTSDLLHDLALLLLEKASYDEAESLMRRALAIDEASYGPEHPNVARGLNNLVLLLHATNRLGEAEPLMRRGLYIFMRFTFSTGHLHPYLKTAFKNYSTLLQASELSDEEIAQRLASIGGDAGLDATTYHRLLAELFS